MKEARRPITPVNPRDTTDMRPKWRGYARYAAMAMWLLFLAGSLSPPAFGEAHVVRAGQARAEMVLVEDGVARAAIVMAENAAPSAAQAAHELAEYIEKISGARLVVATGVPDPMPDSVMWVGVQPAATPLVSPGTFEFGHPEEILYVCNGRHLVVAGRDRVIGDKQVEHGTANAVYTLPLVWSAQGVQYYVMAQMAYDPFQDGDALLEDYYRRGFGPAAREVRTYFELMEQAHDAILDRIRHSSSLARKAVAIYADVCTDALLTKAEALLDQAAKSCGNGPTVHQQRVAFVQVGCTFTRLQRDIMRAMADVRASEGKDTAAVSKAIQLCEKRAQMYRAHYPTFALRYAS